jgi:hypothetical protein
MRKNKVQYQNIAWSIYTNIRVPKANVPELCSNGVGLMDFDAPSAVRVGIASSKPGNFTSVAIATIKLR